MTETDRYTEQEKGLERNLTAWQLAMIAIGGAIGVGLFLGSGATIGLAGPGVILSYLILALRGQAAFLPLFGTAVATMFSIWIVIFVCHIRFRRELDPETLAGLHLKMPAHPFPSVLAILFLVALLATTPFVAGLEWTVPFFLVWLGILAALYRGMRSRVSSAIVK